MLEFNIHGVGLRIEGDPALEGFFKEEYRYFLAESLDKVDLLIKAVDKVSGSECELVSMREGRKYMVIPFSRLSEDPVVVLYERGLMPAFVIYMTEPLVTILAARLGLALIHACCIVDKDRCIVFPSWGGVGKTSIVLHFMSQGFGYMADDWVFVGLDGCAYAYPRRIRIYSYNLKAFPWLKKKLKNKLKFIRMEVMDFFSRKAPWRFARIVFKKFTPYYSVHADQLFPGCLIPRKKPISCVFLMRRGFVEKVSVREVSLDYVVDRVAAAFAFERNYFYQVYLKYLFFKGSVREIDCLLDRVKEIVSGAFRDKPLYLLDLPKRYDIREVYETILSYLPS